MGLAHLLPLLDDDRAVVELAARIAAGGRETVADLPAAAKPFVAMGLAVRLRRPLLIVVSRPDHAADLCELLSQYAPAGVTVQAWSTSDTIPYERLPRDPAKAAAQLSALVHWAKLDREGGPTILVAPARGLMQQVMTPAELRATTQALRVGDQVDAGALLRRWAVAGYQPVSLVEGPGTFCRRGGIVDIWPPTLEWPVRLEFWGDVIDSLRTFDPATQRSQRKIEQLSVPPPVEVPLWRLQRALPAIEAEADLGMLRPEAVDEWRATLARLLTGMPVAELELLTPYLLERPASLLDYLPEDALVFVDEPDSVAVAGSQVETQAEELRAQFEREGELPAGLRRPYHAWAALWTAIQERASLTFGSAPAGEDAAEWTLSGFAPATALGGQTDRLVALVDRRTGAGERTVLVSEQSERVCDILAEHDIYAVARKGVPGAGGRGQPAAGAPPAPGTVEVVRGSLGGGWSHDGLRLLVLGDLELFGWQRQRRAATRRRSSAAARAFVDRLKPGDYVVHIEHGIAQFGGLVQREAGGVEREYLLLQYAGADRLFVPVDQSDRVLAYTGPAGGEPKLNRLGSPDWERTKRRVRKAVADLAQDLLAIYAARETVSRPAHPVDSQWQREMEEAFPYEETPDQARTIAEVKADMEDAEPMDRLICGDVGYGKTEVALRAAFKAINGGRQVAVLVPTTVLALQHFETFSRRLATFPVRVEMLSRLRNKRQQEATITGLVSGQVDIVIGTHRLLQRDVRFRNLGLVIVDEEQRFGVRHKERLKQLRVEVDVLTLSATPIPRTLHMSLVGVRDMSIIETPPEERLPIRTFVRPASDDLVREVILRELDRGGQVYFVHNRVQSIAHVAHRLRELVPEARFLIGHGQMEETELERVMLAFVHGEADVLICTTIIESGLDIANVNTLIVDNAVNFGLAQLYQLRGRVGRSSNRAYAYLLYDAARPMSIEAQERLEAIQEATELGSGFRIAMKDLELRGAGNLLGAEQHGHMEAVGFDLYTRMLAQAVEVARGNPPPPEMAAIKLDLPLDAHLPADYVPDPDLRLTLYQRLAQPAGPPAIAELERELVDRFGPLPEPARNLLEVLRIKSQAVELGIESIGSIEGELVARPVPTASLDTRALARVGRGAVRTTPNTVRLDLRRLGADWLSALYAVLRLIEEAKERAIALAG